MKNYRFDVAIAIIFGIIIGVMAGETMTHAIQQAKTEQAKTEQVEPVPVPLKPIQVEPETDSVFPDNIPFRVKEGSEKEYRFIDSPPVLPDNIPFRVVKPFIIDGCIVYQGNGDCLVYYITGLYGGYFYYPNRPDID